MYQPKKYKKEDRKFIFEFIQNHPFATFIIKGDQLLATHIPVLIQGTPDRFTLYAHIANHNEQFQYVKDGLEALIIFHGAQGYVSSSWYKEKDISTWDYSAVHINVELQVQHRKELEESLIKLVGRFEKEQKNPVYYKNIPKEMREEHLSLITGFWCHPLRVQAIAKLHQGFDSEDINSVTNHLEKRENPLDSALSENIKEEHNAHYK